MIPIKLPTATRRIQFCAGHRVMGHENKCAHLHGHNYVAFVTARVKPALATQLFRDLSQSVDPQAAFLDEIGRVVDFSVLKEQVGGWIESKWDHGFILSKDDNASHRVIELAARSLPNGQKLHIMPYNPTAENMARYLLQEVGPKVLAGTPSVELCHVRIWETENCYADASLADHELVAISSDSVPTGD